MIYYKQIQRSLRNVLSVEEERSKDLKDSIVPLRRERQKEATDRHHELGRGAALFWLPSDAGLKKYIITRFMAMRIPAKSFQSVDTALPGRFFVPLTSWLTSFGQLKKLE